MLTHDIPKRKFLPTLQRSEPLIKDHTSVKTFMECNRKYFYRMVLGRVSRKPEMEIIFAWGSAIHKFAEVYLAKENQALDDVARLTLAVGEANKIYKMPTPGSKWDYLNVKRFIDTIKALKTFLDGEKSRVKIHGVEQAFNFTFPNGDQGGGRWDVIQEYAGSLWVVDYKTTTKQTRYFVETLDPNDQATGYVYAASIAQGWSPEKPDIRRKCAGVKFVVIQNLKPAKSGGPNSNPPVVSIYNVTKSNDQLVSWAQQRMQKHEQITSCREADEWPMDPTNCTWCDYKRVCREPTAGAMEYNLKNNFDYEPWDHSSVEQTKKVESGE